MREIAAVVPGSVLTTAVAELRTPEMAACYPEVPGVEACGLTLLVDTLALPQDFAFHVRTALPNGTRVIA
jgi:hypothetical protein